MNFLAFILLFITSFANPVKPFKQEGRAYVYAEKLSGRPTFSGEKYNPELITAAHATLPMKCIVQVTNLKTGKKILVKINDRMARSRYTVIDLSRAAAARLGLTKQGGGQVRIERSAKFNTEAYLAFINADTLTAKNI